MLNIFLLSMALSGHPAQIVLAEADTASTTVPMTSAIVQRPESPGDQPAPEPMTDAQRAAADEYAGKVISAYPENYRGH